MGNRLVRLIGGDGNSVYIDADRVLAVDSAPNSIGLSRIYFEPTWQYWMTLRGSPDEIGAFLSGKTK